GGRWDRARAAARDAISNLGSADRSSLVQFSSGPEVLVRSVSDKSQMESALDTAALSAGITRYAPALKLAASIVGESPLPRREVILISDFQRQGWRGAEGVHLPDRTTLTTVPITGDEASANVSVTPVALEHTTFVNQQRVTVTAGATNRTDKPVSNLALTLQI